MKKIIFIFVSILLISCKKDDNNKPAPQAEGKISFIVNAQTVTYTGQITQSNGLGTGVTEETSTTPILYSIRGASSISDFFQMTFANSVKLTSGQVDYNSGVADISYFKGDSLYISNGTGFVINFSSFANDKLNGTFSGVLTTQYGTSITITNGQMTNVGVIK